MAACDRVCACVRVRANTPPRPPAACRPRLLTAGLPGTQDGKDGARSISAINMEEKERKQSTSRHPGSENTSQPQSVATRQQLSSPTSSPVIFLLLDACHTVNGEKVFWEVPVREAGLACAIRRLRPALWLPCVPCLLGVHPGGHIPPAHFFPGSNPFAAIAFYSLGFIIINQLNGHSFRKQ